MTGSIRRTSRAGRLISSFVIARVSRTTDQPVGPNKMALSEYSKSERHFERTAHSYDDWHRTFADLRSMGQCVGLPALPHGTRPEHWKIPALQLFVETPADLVVRCLVSPLRSPYDIGSQNGAAANGLAG